MLGEDRMSSDGLVCAGIAQWDESLHIYSFTGTESGREYPRPTGSRDWPPSAPPPSNHVHRRVPSFFPTSRPVTLVSSWKTTSRRRCLSDSEVHQTCALQIRQLMSGMSLPVVS